MKACLPRETLSLLLSLLLKFSFNLILHRMPTLLNEATCFIFEDVSKEKINKYSVYVRTCTYVFMSKREITHQVEIICYT